MFTIIVNRTLACLDEPDQSKDRMEQQNLILSEQMWMSVEYAEDKTLRFSVFGESSHGVL
jgi:hypothetical protein